VKIDRPRFLEPTAAPPKPPSKWKIGWDIWADIWIVVTIFISVTIGAAVIYYCGTPHGWGIQPTFQGEMVSKQSTMPPPRSFAECVYFSVVTIATLGYGDYRPESYGRLVASFEVIAGIVLMGFFIARLVSRPQDRLAKLLVGGQLNTEIQDFRKMVSELLERHTTLVRDNEGCLSQNQELMSQFLNETQRLTKSIARYWRYNANHPDLGEVMPIRATGRLLGDLIETLQCISDDFNQHGPRALSKRDWIFVRNITDSVLSVACVVDARMEDDGLKHLSQRIYTLIRHLSDQLGLTIERSS
jgi:hypothetical protein